MYKRCTLTAVESVAVKNQKNARRMSWKVHSQLWVEAGCPMLKLFDCHRTRSSMGACVKSWSMMPGNLPLPHRSKNGEKAAIGHHYLRLGLENIPPQSDRQGAVAKLQNAIGRVPWSVPRTDPHRSLPTGLG